MSQDQEKRERSHLQHAAEHAKPHKKVSVMGYLAILFAAAFLLLLLSYFMQQRNSEQTISGLKDSVSAMQSVENLIADNDTLRTQVEALNEEVKRLNGEVESLTQQNSQYYTFMMNQEKEITAMDWLWRIQRAWSRGAHRECRDLVDQFEATDYPRWLPSDSSKSTYFPDGPSPADQYDALLDALNYRPEP